jgi:hypothetical protein
MNTWIKWDGEWSIKGNGPAPAKGEKVPVTKRTGETRVVTVAELILSGRMNGGAEIWIASAQVEPREDRYPAGARVARPWKNYDEVGMHGEQ